MPKMYLCDECSFYSPRSEEMDRHRAATGHKARTVVEGAFDLKR